MPCRRSETCAAAREAHLLSHRSRLLVHSIRVGFAKVLPQRTASRRRLCSVPHMEKSSVCAAPAVLVFSIRFANTCSSRHGEHLGCVRVLRSACGKRCSWNGLVNHARDGAYAIGYDARDNGSDYGATEEPDDLAESHERTRGRGRTKIVSMTFTLGPLRGDRFLRAIS